MRPEILFPLFAPVTDLPGVGPRTGKLIGKAAGPHVIDLIKHPPSGIIDRRYAPKIAEARDGAIATMTLTIGAHQPPPKGRHRLPYKVTCFDETGTLTLVFFHGRPDYLTKVLPEGETRVISGRLEEFRGELQITHPDHIATLEEKETLESVEPVYPLTAGLTAKTLSKAIRAALEKTPDLPQWLDGAYFSRMGWTSWKESILALHHPLGEADLSLTTGARSRLAYDELLASQLAMALVRARYRRRPGRKISGDGVLRQRAMDALPFSLTNSQKDSLSQIESDMGDASRMLRLLQGDVGCGKTVVALMAMLNAAETGAQSALMAPTEILARQHMATIEPLAAAAGVQICLLSAREKGKVRKEILENLASGKTMIAIGTHALFQDDVVFQDLALAVIDEQHRFGVQQRVQLTDKGHGTDVLVMTATPIPRTLTLAAYGDMDISRITEKPPGRGSVETSVIPLSRLDEVVGAVKRRVDSGGQVYWVCPLIEDSEVLDVAAATERYDHLKGIFGDRAGLVHGSLKPKEKDAVMARFSNGEISVLVATTVIEVGVDVPAATVMVVEHAERFGLAQLHQLRGRIGRGSEASSCLLLYAAPLGETAAARLKTLRQSDDGFAIAEEDLRLRGAGELLGTRQSGLPEFHFADLVVHGELLAAARDDARLILENDPGLEGTRGAPLKTLLYLFERDGVVKYARSG